MNNTDWKDELLSDIVIPIVKRCIYELVVNSVEYLLYGRSHKYGKQRYFNLRESRKHHYYI